LRKEVTLTNGPAVSATEMRTPARARARRLAGLSPSGKRGEEKWAARWRGGRGAAGLRAGLGQEERRSAAGPKTE
jgi:hypothetical protein